MLKKLRSVWMLFVEVLGKVQTTILLSIVYHLALGPLAVGAKASRRDLLELTPSQEPSYVKGLAGVSSTLEKAQRQF
jgi:hypothetical protein